MSYANPPQLSGRQAIWISAAVLLHLILGYALVNGLGRKVVEVLKKPLDVAIIDEAKPLPPPPPPKSLPPPPKASTPPPSYVPPVEVPISAPAAPTITTSKAPVPEAPPAPAAPPTPINVAVACPNQAAVRSRVAYPAQAQRLGLSGDVVAEFTLNAAGEIRDITVTRSTNQVFNPTVIEAVGKLQCNGQGRDVRVRVPFSFRLDN